jgi:hypothetical protein
MHGLCLALALLGQYRTCNTAAAYRVPAYQAYAAPQYSYQAAPSYGYAQNYVEKVLFVPVEYNDPYYVSVVGDQMRAQARARTQAEAQQNLVDQVQKLAETVGRLEAVVGGQAPVQESPPVVQQPPPAVPPPTPQPPVAPPVAPPPQPGGDPVTAAAVAILQQKCAKCHTGATSKGDFALFDDAGRLAQVGPLDLLMIDHQTYSQKMPPGKPLTDPEYQALRDWVGQTSEAIAASVKKKPPVPQPQPGGVPIR